MSEAQSSSPVSAAADKSENPYKRTSKGKILVIQCRVCDKRMKFQNYEVHLKSQHPREDHKNLRTKNSQSIKNLFENRKPATKRSSAGIDVNHNFLGNVDVCDEVPPLGDEVRPLGVVCDEVPSPGDICDEVPPPGGECDEVQVPPPSDRHVEVPSSGKGHDEVPPPADHSHEMVPLPEDGDDWLAGDGHEVVPVSGSRRDELPAPAHAGSQVKHAVFCDENNHDTLVDGHDKCSEKQVERSYAPKDDEVENVDSPEAASLPRSCNLVTQILKTSRRRMFLNRPPQKLLIYL